MARFLCLYVSKYSKLNYNYSFDTGLRDTGQANVSRLMSRSLVSICKLNMLIYLLVNKVQLLCRSRSSRSCSSLAAVKPFKAMSWAPSLPLTRNSVRIWLCLSAEHHSFRRTYCLFFEVCICIKFPLRGMENLARLYLTQLHSLQGNLLKSLISSSWR